MSTVKGYPIKQVRYIGDTQSFSGKTLIVR